MEHALWWGRHRKERERERTVILFKGPNSIYTITPGQRAEETRKREERVGN